MNTWPVGPVRGKPQQLFWGSADMSQGLPFAGRVAGPSARTTYHAVRGTKLPANPAANGRQISRFSPGHAGWPQAAGSQFSTKSTKYSLDRLFPGIEREQQEAYACILLKVLLPNQSVDVGYNFRYTSIMKTAVSIPDSVFEAAETVAQRFRSRGASFIPVLSRNFCELHGAQNVTERLDRVYAENPSELDPGVVEMQRRSLADDPW